jgi:hypothetical protein
MSELVLDPEVEALQEVSGRRLLAALVKEQRPRPEAALRGGAARAPATGVMERVHAAGAKVDALGNVGLTVSFKQVQILDAQAGGFDWGRGEVYVVTSVLDGSGKQPDFKTQMFEGIHDRDFLPLGDGGMLVGLIQNPRWFVDLHMLIMESDEDIRSIGEAIEQARKDSKLSEAAKAVGALAAFDPTKITLVVNAVDAFLAILAGILSANGDDHIATVHDFYLKHQAFGAGPHPRAGGLGTFQLAKVAYSIDLAKL